jgi:hypothetical protein
MIGHSIEQLSSAEGFMPHGMCYLWQPGILALHVISDGLITLAYMSIPLTLVYFVRRRADLRFHWIFLCFATFIIACGLTHLMEIWTIWHPAYWLSGSIKAVTALASVATSILLIKLIPYALRLTSPALLQSANLGLKREVSERHRVEEDLRQANATLEVRVADRTAELESLNFDCTVARRSRDRNLTPCGWTAFIPRTERDAKLKWRMLLTTARRLTLNFALSTQTARYDI